METALRLVDEDGLDSLSMRRLGAALGVEAMSLYNHVGNKSEIMDAIHLKVLQLMEIPGGRPEARDWEVEVSEAARAFRAVLKAHPRTIPLMASRAAVSPESLAYFDAGVGLLLRAGLPPDQSVHAFQTIFAFVVGHAAFHFSRLGEEPQDLDALYRGHPALAQAATLGAYDAGLEFEFGLELLIEGLRRKIAASRYQADARSISSCLRSSLVDSSGSPQ